MKLLEKNRVYIFACPLSLFFVPYNCRRMATKQPAKMNKRTNALSYFEYFGILERSAFLWDIREYMSRCLSAATCIRLRFPARKSALSWTSRFSKWETVFVLFISHVIVLASSLRSSLRLARRGRNKKEKKKARKCKTIFSQQKTTFNSSKQPKNCLFFVKCQSEGILIFPSHFFIGLELAVYYGLFE